MQGLSDAMHHSAVIAALRARIAEIEGVGTRHGSLPFGVAKIDRHLPSGGLIGGAPHEIAGGPGLADDASATIFLCSILARRDVPVL